MGAIAAGVVVPLPYYLVRWRVLPGIGTATGGRVTVGDWSASWASGLTLRNVRVAGAGGGEAAVVGQVHCEFNPWQALRGRYVLGKTTVDGVQVHLRVGSDGGTNFDGLFQGSGAPLLLSADVAARVEQVTLDLPGVEAIALGGGSLTASVDTAGPPLTHTLDLSRVHLAGQSVLFHDGRILPAEQRTADETAKFQDVAVRTAVAGSGAVAGDVHWTLGDHGAEAVQGSVHAAGPSLVLRGDTLRLRDVSVPFGVRRAADGRLTVERLAIDSPEITAAVEGDFTAGAVRNLLHALPPGEAGKVHLTAKVNDLPGVVGQLPHVLTLARDARVTGGRVSHELTATWTGEAVTLKAGGELAAEGTKGGRAVSIAPVTAAVSGVAKPTAGGGWPEVSGVAANVHSAFMTVDAHAESLGAVRASGDLSLDKLVQQVGQFVDLSGVTAAGTGRFTIETGGGSLAEAGRPVDVRASVNLDGARLLLPSGRVVVDEPQLSLSASTQVDRTRPAGVGRLRRLDVKLQSRSGSVSANGESLAALDFVADLDLAKLREQVRTVVDLGPMWVGGRASVKASTRGDLSRAGSPIAAKVSARIEGASVAGVRDIAPLELTNLSFEASADVRRDAAGVPAGLANATTMLTVGDPANPGLGLSAAGEVDIAARAVPQFAVSRLTAELPFVERLLTPLLPPSVARLQAPRGRVTVAASGSWDGRTLTLPKPAVVEVTGLSIGPAGLSEEGLPVRNENVTLNVAGQMNVARGVNATLSTLSLMSSSKLLDVHLDKGQPLVVRRDPIRGPLATGAVMVSADLARLAGAAGPLVGVSADVLGPEARVDGSATFTTTPDAHGQAVGADVTFAHVTAPPYFSDAPVHVTGAATVTPAAVDFAGAVESPAVSGSVANGRYVLKRSSGQPTAGWLEGLTRLDVAATLPDLAAAHAAVTGPSSPVTLASGKLSGRASLVREGPATAVRLADVRAAGLSVRAGGQVVHDGDATLAATVLLESAASDPARLAAVRLSDVRAAFGPTEFVVTDPVSLTDLGMPVPTIAGSIRTAGPIGPAWQVASTFLGLPPTAATGEYILTQQLSTAAGKLHLTGGMTVSNFALQRGDQALFADPQVSVTNDGDFDAATNTFSATSLKFAPSTGAASIEAKGRLIDWRGSRQLDQVSVGVDYDWAKLWPLVLPHLPGELQGKLKELKIAGQHHAVVDVRGSLPSGADPLRTLTGSTVVSAASMDLGTNAFRDVVLPLTLQNGQVRTAYPDGHPAPAAKFNGGTVDLSEWTVDLNNPAGPRFTLPRNTVVLRDVKLDVPLAGEWLGAYCPLLAGAREADGRLSVTVADCTNVDPAQLSVAGASAQGQKLELLFTITDLRTAGPFTDVLQPLIDPPGLSGVTSVRDGHVTLQDGQAVTDMTVRLNQAGGSDLNFKSTVRLSDRALMPMTVSIPKGVLPAARQAGPGAVANLPDKVELPIDGTADHPQPRTDALTKQIQDAAAKAQTPATAAPAGH